MAERKLTKEEVQTRPWKYVGYKVFSSMLASDPDFFVLRRFDNLNARVLLMLQWEISTLETQLSDIDTSRSARSAPDHNNGSFTHDDEERLAIIRTIYLKLKEYNKYLVNYSSLRQRPEVSEQDQRNVKNWLKTYDGAIDETESLFIQNRDDLLGVAAIAKTPLRNAFEKLEAFRWFRYFRRTPEIVSLKEQKLQYFDYDPEVVMYTSEHRIDHFLNVVICVVGFAMLIAPLWILLYVQGRSAQLAIITIFVMLFLVLVQTISVARPFENLAATAAYSAVLMVFVPFRS